MIIACPSCATRHQFTEDQRPIPGSVINCTACGHSWVEGGLIEVEDVAFETAPLPVPTNPAVSRDAARIARAAREADEKRRAEKSKRARMRNGWLAFATAACLPVAVAAAFPDAVANAVPASARLYQAVGLDVNIHGLELQKVTHQYILADNTRVLAIRGNVVNVTTGSRKVPSLRFALTDKANREVYSWVLDGVSRKKLGAGQSTIFVTRLASPPQTAENLQIRFARAGETRKAVKHVSNNTQRTSN